MQQLKQRLRRPIAEAWLAATDVMPRGLLDPQDLWHQGARDAAASAPLQLWQSLHDKVTAVRRICSFVGTSCGGLASGRSEREGGSSTRQCVVLGFVEGK